jgi:hypothetical protein
VKRLAIALFALTVVASVCFSMAAQGTGWIASEHVRFIKNIPEAADGVGARVVGSFMYVTSSKGLQIYDLADPENPVQIGGIMLQVHWENEQVPTNGTLLGISSSDGCMKIDTTKRMPDPGRNQRGNCLSIYDVRDKANPAWLTSVWDSGAHTNTCVLDCSYMWSSNGLITDLRHVLEPGHPASVVGNWLDGLGITSTHHQTEVSPGIVLSASQPVFLLSTQPSDGGSPTKPKVLAKGSNEDGRFIHSSMWPRHGADKFALIGGETNGMVRCDAYPTGAFMTWKRSSVAGKLTMVDEFMLSNGTFTDGSPPVNHLGCSAHWFEEHPSFHDGGLVALGAYEHGTRFMRVDAAGMIHQAGWFMPLNGSTSAPHWAPDGKTIYAIDYQRGIDVIQWTGPTYVPALAKKPPKVLGAPVQRRPLPTTEVPGDVAPGAVARRRSTTRAVLTFPRQGPPAARGLPAAREDGPSSRAAAFAIASVLAAAVGAGVRRRLSASR